MTEVTKQYRKKQFTYANLQHHAYINELLIIDFLASHDGQSLHVQGSLHKDVS